MATVRKVAVSGKFVIKLTKWHVKQGEDITKDANLASYVYCNSNENASSASLAERKLKSRFEGRVSKVLAKQGDEVPPGQPVIFIEENQCQHTIIMKDMCCECGEDLRQEIGVPGNLSEPVAAEIPMVHNIPELRVSLEEAEKIARYDERQLLKSKKLALVVDLDQTLIHTTHEAVPRDIPDLFHYRLPDHPVEYHTKLRPGAKAFLEAVSRFYELHIFTMGSRMYAHTIARHLDPDEKLFAHRIRSRDECMDYFSKSQDLRALFPCGDHMVCIIDDREDVWNFAPNLITVKPYRFFKGTGDINDPFASTETSEKTEKTEPLESTKDSEDTLVERANENGIGKEDCPGNGLDQKSEKEENEEDGKKTCVEDHDVVGDKSENSKEQENKPDGEVSDPADVDNDSNGSSHPPDLDDYLFYLEEILERIHGSFYSTIDAIKAKGGIARQDPTITRFCSPGTANPDTRAIVPALRQQTLQGANIVFTGVVPTNVPLKNSAVYRAAIRLGANVTDNILRRKGAGRADKSSDSTTHVVAARLGTEKAYRASKSPGIKLVGPEWLWCCSQRWEWVDERLFPVPSRSRGNGDDTPEVSKRGTPTLVEIGKCKGDKLKAKEAAKGDGKKLSRGRIPTPDEILESIEPVAFSKDELDEMDKEVEEYMLSDNDEDADVLGSISGSGSSSGGRSSTDSSSSSSSRNSSNSKLTTTMEDIRKRKKKLYDELAAVQKKKRALLSGPPVDDNDARISSSSSSSNSSENSLLSEDDLHIGAMLEKQIDD